MIEERRLSNIDGEDFFELMYELVDIEDIEYTDEFVNMIDISLNDNDRTFVLSNGIITHNSARTGLMPILGRQEFGFYEMKGKPLNAYDSSVQKFTSNKELSDLFQIINSEEYEYIIFATDQDLDGFTIRGLLIGFFQRYLPELIQGGRVGSLDTPIIALEKGGEIKHWYYSMNDVDEKLYKTHNSTYYKGLGTWEKDDLKYIIEQGGVESMIKIFESTPQSEEVIDDWLNGEKIKSDKRKEYIEGNEFDLIKL